MSDSGWGVVPVLELDLVDTRVDCLIERQTGPCTLLRPHLEDFGLGIVGSRHVQVTNTGRTTTDQLEMLALLQQLPSLLSVG